MTLQRRGACGKIATRFMAVMDEFHRMSFGA